MKSFGFHPVKIHLTARSIAIAFHTSFFLKNETILPIQYIYAYTSGALILFSYRSK